MNALTKVTNLRVYIVEHTPNRHGRNMPGVPETNHLADQPTDQVIALMHSSRSVISRIKTKKHKKAQPARFELARVSAIDF